jgi:hypothetical protein
MEKNIEYKNYLTYIIDELNKIESSGSRMILRKINEMGNEEDIIKLLKMVEFMYISENIRLPLYHEWYRHFR